MIDGKKIFTYGYKRNSMRDFASTNDCTEIESTNDCAGTKRTEINSAKNHGKCKRHWDQ